MKVSVIIINYNTFTLTSNCIRSVIEQTKSVDYEIIVVDNASAECDPNEFVEKFPSIKLVRSAINGGFAKGNNLGIEQSNGDHILLLNSDTILTEDSITRCVEELLAHPQIAVIGCRMVYPDGSIQYTARKFRSIGWELLDLFRFLPWMLPYTKRSRLMLGKYFRHDENIDCDWVNGAFFLFPKSILRSFPANKVDDRFFMYGEDQLWCEQIKEAGYGIHFFARTTIIHINSGSTDLTKQLSLRRIMMKHELEIMRLRKGKGVYYYMFKIIYVSKESFRNLIKSVYHRITGKLMR
jgi:GT2 family glycosyltransferase